MNRRRPLRRGDLRSSISFSPLCLFVPPLPPTGSTRAMLLATKALIPAEHLAVHFHDTYGQALVNILTGRKEQWQ